MSGNCVGDMSRTESPSKSGTVDRVWTLAFAPLNAFLKAIGVLSEII
jgi:hypothetical protein